MFIQRQMNTQRRERKAISIRNILYFDLVSFLDKIRTDTQRRRKKRVEEALAIDRQGSKKRKKTYE
jgi:hypothetical protein